MAVPAVAKRILGTAVIAYLTIRVVNAVARSMQASTNTTVAKIGTTLTG